MLDTDYTQKMEFFTREAECVGHRIGKDGVRSIQDKLEPITKTNIPKNEKELKSFFGGIHYLKK